MTAQPRATAQVRRVDVSSPRPRRSPEAALFQGYARVGPRYRTEPCVCGGEIRAETGWEMAAVMEHQQTDLHRAWRERMGL